MTAAGAGTAAPGPEEHAALVEALRTGEIDVIGRVSDASNLTLFGTLDTALGTLSCVYKPVRGERPLWDFPDGTLAEREVLAHDLAVVAGWYCVPPTVLRPGPLGEGMLQLWVGPAPTDPELAEADPVEELVTLVPAQQVPDGWLPVFRARDDDGRLLAVCHADDPRLALLAGFDAVVNNADRKAPHLVPAGDRVYGVDHGLTFHTEDKLRTILWGFAGRPLPDAVRDGVRRLRRHLEQPPDDDSDPATRLTGREVRALRRRIERLAADPRFPEPPDDRTAIPWPPL